MVYFSSVENMTKQEYKQMLEKMRKELDSLLELQEDTEQKIAQLKQAIMSLAPLAKESNESKGFWDTVLSEIKAEGITENIREILQVAYPNLLSPVEIREQLRNRGQDFSGHKNVMASIHSTLKRMVENEEIRTSEDGLAYGWRRKAMTPPPKLKPFIKPEHTD